MIVLSFATRIVERDHEEKSHKTRRYHSDIAPFEAALEAFSLSKALRDTAEDAYFANREFTKYLYDLSDFDLTRLLRYDSNASVDSMNPRSKLYSGGTFVDFDDRSMQKVTRVRVMVLLCCESSVDLVIDELVRWLRGCPRLSLLWLTRQRRDLSMWRISSQLGS